jgi:hypothetical protein
MGLQLGGGTLKWHGSVAGVPGAGLACFASTPLTSALKELTLSRSPLMMACRCRAMPCPAMNLASASALAWISVRLACAWGGDRELLEIGWVV